MTNPTQRAADEINDTIGWWLIEEFCEMSPAFFSKARRAFAHAVFESIDVDDLEGVIRKVMLRGAIVADVDLPTYIAHAVKAHLTGKREGGAD